MKQKVGLITFILFVFIVILKICPVDFQDNDDYIYAVIMSGAYSGTPSPLSVYLGYYYGCAVSALYRLFPGTVEWYTLVMHFLYLLSFVVIVWKLLSSRASRPVKLLVTAAASAFQLYLLLSPQFTIVAGELTLAATVSLLGQPKKRDYVGAALLLLIASQIRLQALLMVALPMFPLLFLPLELKKKSYWTKPLYLLSVLVVAFALSTYGNRVYTQQPDWQYFMAFNQPRGAIEQNLCKTEAEVLFTDSVKKNEYSTFCRFGLIDGKILSIEEMNACADYLSEQGSSFFKVNVVPYYYGLRNQCFWIIGTLGLCLLVISYRKRRWTEFSILCLTGLLFLAELFYCMNTSFVKERIILCFVFYLFALVSICSYRLLSPKTLFSLTLGCAILISAYYVRKSYKWEKDIEERLAVCEEMNALLEQVPAEKVHVMGLPVYAEAYAVSKTPCTAKYIGKGWLNNIPLHQPYYSGYASLVDGAPILKRKGDNENLEVIKFALQKRYGKSVDCKVLFESENLEVVQF